MGSPTSDDDPTGRVDGPGDPGGRGGPGHPPPGPGPSYPPPGQAPSYPPPGAYGYGQPPPSAERSNRGLVIALVVGLVILIALCVALVFAFTRDSGDTISSGTSTTTSAEPDDRWRSNSDFRR
jgi:serine/threonine-protein kinase